MTPAVRDVQKAPIAIKVNIRRSGRSKNVSKIKLQNEGDKGARSFI